MRDLEYQLVRDPRVYAELVAAVSDHYENVAFLVTEHGTRRYVSVRVSGSDLASSDHIRSLVEDRLRGFSEPSPYLYAVEVRSVDDIVSMPTVQPSEDVN